MQVPDSAVDAVLAAAREAAFEPAQEAVLHLVYEGYGVAAVLERLLDRVLAAESGLDDAQRAHVAATMAAADKCLVDGADSALQLQHVVSVLQCVMNGK